MTAAQLTAKRKEAARKAVETRRARQAAQPKPAPAPREPAKSLLELAAAFNEAA